MTADALEHHRQPALAAAALVRKRYSSVRSSVFDVLCKFRSTRGTSNIDAAEGTATASATLTTILSSAEKSAERPEETAGESRCLVLKRQGFLCKWPLLAAMHLACGCRHLVGGQIDVVNSPGCLAARGSKLI